MTRVCLICAIAMLFMTSGPSVAAERDEIIFEVTGLECPLVGGLG